MNFKNLFNSRRFKYGSMSVAISALVIAAVIIFNVVFSVLASKYNWYIDLTTEGVYTLSDNCIELLDETFETLSTERVQNGEEKPLKVKIKFCDLEANIMESTSHRYVLMTAKELANRFPDYVDIEFINIWENPTAVEKYKTSVLTSILSTHVILESGSEYRAYDLSSFYLLDSDSVPWAYYGEKRFASGILAVTQAEAPIAAVLTGHGELFTDDALFDVLDMAGYKVITIDDLVNEEIPEDCRLMISYQPTGDFIDSSSVSEVSEITVIEEFLAGNNHSFMVFMSPTARELPVLEGYLELWGISFMRETTDKGAVNPYIVKDMSQALTNDGLTFMGEYVTGGVGGFITRDMRSTTVPKRVVFKSAMPMDIADGYGVYHEINSDTGESYRYGSKIIGSGVSRESYFIFTASQSAVAMANGKESLKATESEPFGLMMISRQQRLVQDDDYGISTSDLSSYVFACGSAQTFTSSILESNTYGNSEMFMKVFYEMGKENVPTGLIITPFADTTIDTLTVDRANAYTVVLTVIPAALIFGVGIYVIVRRKHR